MPRSKGEAEHDCIVAKVQGGEGVRADHSACNPADLLLLHGLQLSASSFDHLIRNIKLTGQHMTDHWASQPVIHEEVIRRRHAITQANLWRTAWPLNAEQSKRPAPELLINLSHTNSERPSAQGQDGLVQRKWQQGNVEQDDKTECCRG